jgi:hypothetical protein
MRARVAAFLVPAVALATITVMPPAKEKSSLLGAWESLDDWDDTTFVYRMVLLPSDDGYLVWPRLHDEKAPEAAAFLGRLAKLEFQEGHVRLLFKRLPNQTHLGGSRYDSIEIEGDVRAAEDVKEATRVAVIEGTTTVRRDEDQYSETRPLRMGKPAGFVGQYVRRLAAEARRAEELIAQERKPGPLGSREGALAVLRELEIIRDGTRVVSAEWSESSREWHVELQQRDTGRTSKIAVNVPAHDFYYMDDPSK